LTSLFLSSFFVFFFFFFIYIFRCEGKRREKKTR
jgi:hypothetical protein